MNINYEQDTRHDVSNRMLKSLKEVSYKQDDYGMEKYKKPLHFSHNYSWLDMFLEEIADGLKYIQCEMDRKAEIIHILEMGLRSDVPKEYIEMALELLTVGGTGK